MTCAPPPGGREACRRHGSRAALLTFAIGAILSVLRVPTALAQQALMLKNLGVAPMSWQVATPEVLDIEDNKELAGRSFSRVVESSGRFRVVNDELIGRLILDGRGRDVLKQDYELDAAMVMEAEADKDTVHFTLKLLSAGLQHLLIERKSVSRTEFASKTKAELEDFLKDLTFRLINRLPVDVYVTSLQGGYVTVSGGQDQGLGIGERLEFLDVRVTRFHPADSTWIGFERRPAGKVELIDVKPNSSVGRIIEENRPNAIAVGNGALAQRQPSREYFRHLEQIAGRQEMKPSQSHVELVAPLFGPGGGAAAEAGRESEPTAAAASAPVIAPQPEPGDASPRQPEGQPHENRAPVPAAGVSEKPMTLADHMKSYADTAYLWFGARQWKFTGPASATGKFPLWLVNAAGGQVKKEIMPSIKIVVGGEFGFGGTGSGDYIGIGALGRVIYESEVESMREAFDQVYFGATGSYQGQAVNGEKYGGGDWLNGGLIAGVGSKLFLVGGRQVIDGFAEFSLTPLTIGRIGYDGSRHGVKSSMGWQFNLGGHLEGPARSLEWGGLIGFSGLNLLFEDGEEGHLSTLSLQALLRYRL